MNPLTLDKIQSLDDMQAIWGVCERILDTFFVTVNLPEPLNEACRYAMAGGGKRIRPMLAMGAFFSLTGGSFAQNRLNNAQGMLIRACLCVELLHGYSLVHDDLPCMDNDDLRRGRPTCHIVYGEGVALLVGDVLQSLAFEILTADVDGLPKADLALSAKLLHIFASRARRMVAGQLLDTISENKTLTQDELQAIHTDKTGALIEASVLMGGACASAEQYQADLYGFAKHLGLAFQVQDDVLDVISDTATLGKPVGSDEKLDKSTYVKLLGVDNAKAYADELFLHALQFAIKIGDDNLLCQLTKRVQERKN